MSHGILADGSDGRIHSRAPASDGAVVGQNPTKDGSGPSPKPRSVGQQDREFDAVYIERRAQALRGYDVALKPSYEPIILARKPVEGSISYNARIWGTGGLNIDACRIGERWPANVLADEETGRLLNVLSKKDVARCFYCPKPSNEERDRGLDDFEAKACGVGALRDNGRGKVAKNTHNTVKPIALMRYLCRLITPPKGVILDPFCGSGSTLVAAQTEGFDWMGIDIMQEYIDIAAARVKAAGYRPEQTEVRRISQSSLDRWF
jgi:site-specific DNA-methyltransferase (adenine-specific)